VATRPSNRTPDRDGSSVTPESGELARFLYRPIVFQEPGRVVHPPSWLEHIPFAFWLVDALRPGTFVELGTQSGNSYASFAQAVQTLGLSTACYAVDTWHGDSQTGFYDESVFAEWSAYHERHFSAFSRLIRSTFAEAAPHFSGGSIDLLHSDGCHTYESLAADLELWRPKLSRRGVILIHEINVREGEFGVWRLWEELKAECPFFEFLHGNGLGVLGVGPDLSEPLQWLFSKASTSREDVKTIRQFFARMGGAISARSAGATIERSLFSSGAPVAQPEIQVSNFEAQLVRERAEHEEDLRHKWQLAAELQERIREEYERRTRVETEYEAQQATISSAERQLKRVEAEYADQQAAIASLESQLTRESKQHEEANTQYQAALRQKSSLVAELQDRLRAESERQDRIEAERARTATASRLRRRLHRLTSRWRNRARSVRTLSRTGAPLRFLMHPAKLREAYAVVVGGLFDEAYYRGCYADVAASRLTPLAHFVLTGAYECRNPHPLFDTAYYLRCNPDVGAAAVNPLLHYRAQGAFEGRSPHPLFDAAYYLDANPDVRSSGMEPLSHFLTVGGAEGRDPSPFFDSSYYLKLYPDVGRSHTNPLLHYVSEGWREGRRPSPAFDAEYYLSQFADVRLLGANPLVHYVEFGRSEGREAVADQDRTAAVAPKAVEQLPQIKLKVKPLAPARTERPAVLCLSHVMPLPPRAGNEYRIYRMLRWLRDQGYRIVPVIAPLPGNRVEANALLALAAEFSNAVLCNRDGRVEYVLGDVPDVLASLNGDFTRPVATLLDEDAIQGEHERQLLEMDRTFCHDALITTALRLHQVLGSYVLLSEYIWMSRILPLITGDVLKVIDTIDVFSTKRQKVLQFGIADLHVETQEEAKRLRYADLVLAIQDEERHELQRLLPATHVVTAGVDFDVVEDPGIPSGRRVLYVASDNPMNRKGLSDFLRFAWPQIHRDVPDAELLVVGNVNRALSVETPGVIQLGPVDDLDALYREARVIINPAVAGTGLKIKTLEALCHFRPIVTWPTGTDGLAPELAALCVTAQDWYEFSRRVGAVLAATEPVPFSDKQRNTIVSLTSPASVYRAMTDAIEAFRGERFGPELGRAGVRV
jgi:hypothetical protein